MSTTIKKIDSGAAPAEDGVKPEMVMGVIAAGTEDATALSFVYSSESKLSGDGLDSKLVMPLGHEMIIDEPSSMPGTSLLPCHLPLHAAGPPLHTAVPGVTP